MNPYTGSLTIFLTYGMRAKIGGRDDRKEVEVEPLTLTLTFSLSLMIHYI